MLDSLQMGFWRSDATMLMVPDQPFTISPLHPHAPALYHTASRNKTTIDRALTWQPSDRRTGSGPVSKSFPRLRKLVDHPPPVRHLTFLAGCGKVRQRHSRKTLPPHYLDGVHKRGALYSARREPQTLNVRPREKGLSWQARGGRVRMNDSPPGHRALTDSRPSTDVTLRPCWTAFCASCGRF
jgi:hypothetical protein